MGPIKDRNGMDLTEAEDIKKRWQEYTEFQSLCSVVSRLLCPWNFPGKNSGLPFPTPVDLPDPGIKPVSPALTCRFFTTSATKVQNTQQTIQKRKKRS